MFFCSVVVPEKLDHFINKYAEYSHEKWSMEKVRDCQFRVDFTNTLMSNDLELTLSCEGCVTVSVSVCSHVVCDGLGSRRFIV